MQPVARDVPTAIEAVPFHHRFGSMGCPCEVVLEGLESAHALVVGLAAQAEVDRLDRKYSHYRDDSLIADFARAANDLARVEVDDETANLLDFAAALHTQSAGRFDITAGPLTRLWDAGRRDLPSPAEIAAARDRVGWHRLHWQRPYLHWRARGMQLDLGGVVKEYAADRAAALCRAQGARAGVVDLGGDLAVIGAHTDGSPWRIGIKTPHATDQASATIALHHGGLATSGDYERALVVDGVRYSHLIDPVAAHPVHGFASVSVVADSCLIAGAASTLAMLAGETAGLQWLHESGLTWLCIDQHGRCLRQGAPSSA